MAKKRNIGGGAWYSGGSSKVAKEAEEKNTGGPVATTKKNKGGAVKRAYGGRAVGKPSGAIAPARLDRRARGGGIGSDKSPFSSAARGSDTGRTSKTTPIGGFYKAGGEVKKK